MSLKLDYNLARFLESDKSQYSIYGRCFWQTSIEETKIADPNKGCECEKLAIRIFRPQLGIPYRYDSADQLHTIFICKDYLVYEARKRAGKVWIESGRYIDAHPLHSHHEVIIDICNDLFPYIHLPGLTPNNVVYYQYYDYDCRFHMQRPLIQGCHYFDPFIVYIRLYGRHYAEYSAKAFLAAYIDNFRDACQIGCYSDLVQEIFRAIAEKLNVSKKKRELLNSIMRKFVKASDADEYELHLASAMLELIKTINYNNVKL